MISSSFGTNESTEEMIQKYAQTVYRLAYAQTCQQSDADDVFQEVFLRYLRKRPVFVNKEHEKAWFLRVTINCAKSLHTTFFRKQTVALDESMPAQEQEDCELAEALAKLPPKYRGVIHLFYYEGYSTDEIANILHQKGGTVRIQLTRARRMLKEQMKEK